MKTTIKLLAIGLALSITACRSTRPQITFISYGDKHAQDSLTGSECGCVGNHEAVTTYPKPSSLFVTPEYHSLAIIDSVNENPPYIKWHVLSDHEKESMFYSTVTWKEFTQGIENDFLDRRRNFQKRLDSIKKVVLTQPLQ